MLQEIHPHLFENKFKNKAPKNNDYMLVFDNEKILMNNINEEMQFTSVQQIKNINPEAIKNSVYLFSIDQTAYFCTLEKIEEINELKYIKTVVLRDLLPEWMTFIAATAGHLAQWYSTNKFCGRCSNKMELNKNERTLNCPECKLIKYPNISPAVIVGIINNDKILLTRYSDRPYKKLSLVAGFVEIGETLEDGIKREVLEEVGLNIKNLRYFKSQPWAFSQSLLMGFFAELDGSDQIKLDESELSEATWYAREEIPECETLLSLTNEMIESFKNNKINT